MICAFAPRLLVRESHAFRVRSVSPRRPHRFCRVNYRPAPHRTHHKLSATLVGWTVCLRSTLCLRPMSTLIPCSHAKLRLGFCVARFTHRILQVNFVSLLFCVGLYFHEPLYLTLSFCIKVTTSASWCPDDRPIRTLGCSFDFAPRLAPRIQPRCLVRCHQCVLHEGVL